MGKRARVTASLAAAALLAAAVAWRVSKSRTWQIAGELVARVDTGERRVALTFDDGPSPERVDEVLGVLAARKIHATFFVVGARVEEDPESLRRIVLAGHEAGNHSFSHRRMLFHGWDFVGSELTRTDALIRAAGFEGEIRFRPPFGKKLVVLPVWLARHHRVTVMWDVEAEADASRGTDAASIRDYVLANARPGSIILFHVWPASRAPERAALPEVLDGLQARGFEVGTVGELLAARRQ